VLARPPLLLLQAYCSSRACSHVNKLSLGSLT
jgi:hypothetical protein